MKAHNLSCCRSMAVKDKDRTSVNILFYGACASRPSPYYCFQYYRITITAARKYCNLKYVSDCTKTAIIVGWIPDALKSKLCSWSVLISLRKASFLPVYTSSYVVVYDNIINREVPPNGSSQLETDTWLYAMMRLITVRTTLHAT